MALLRCDERAPPCANPLRAGRQLENLLRIRGLGEMRIESRGATALMSASRPSPVTAISRSACPDGSSRSRRASSKPSITGMFRSTNAISGRLCLAAASARVRAGKNAHSVALARPAAAPRVCAPSSLSSTTSTRRPPTPRSRLRRVRTPAAFGQCLRASGSRTMNSAPLPDASAARLDAALVQLDQRLHQRETRDRDRRRVRVRFELHEHLEHARQLFRVDAHAVVAHRDLDLAGLGVHGELDAPASAA